jgi:hypothetical protein
VLLLIPRCILMVTLLPHRFPVNDLHDRPQVMQVLHDSFKFHHQEPLSRFAELLRCPQNFGIRDEVQRRKSALQDSMEWEEGSLPAKEHDCDAWVLQQRLAKSASSATRAEIRHKTHRVTFHWNRGAAAGHNTDTETCGHVALHEGTHRRRVRRLPLMELLGIKIVADHCHYFLIRYNVKVPDIVA